MSSGMSRSRPFGSYLADSNVFLKIKWVWIMYTRVSWSELFGLRDPRPPSVVRYPNNLIPQASLSEWVRIIRIGTKLRFSLMFFSASKLIREGFRMFLALFTQTFSTINNFLFLVTFSSCGLVIQTKRRDPRKVRITRDPLYIRITRPQCNSKTSPSLL